MPLTPATPVWPRPSKSKPLMCTTAVVLLMMKPFVAATSTPVSVLSQTSEIDLVMVSDPKPPGSRQLISPPAAVFAIAPWKVLHGAVRLHGLASSPTPEIQVRVAWADAGAA